METINKKEIIMNLNNQTPTDRDKLQGKITNLKEIKTNPNSSYSKLEIGDYTFEFDIIFKEPNLKLYNNWLNLINKCNYELESELFIKTIKDEIWKEDKFDFIVKNFSNFIDELDKEEKRNIVYNYCNDSDCEFEDIMDDLLSDLEDYDKFEIIEKYCGLFFEQPYQTYFKQNSCVYDRMREIIFWKLLTEKF